MSVVRHKLDDKVTYTAPRVYHLVIIISSMFSHRWSDLTGVCAAHLDQMHSPRK